MTTPSNGVSPQQNGQPSQLPKQKHDLLVLPAEEPDYPRIMEIVLPAFADFELEQLHENVPENAVAAGQRYLRADFEHRKKFFRALVYKCVLVPPPSSQPPAAKAKGEIVATASWAIYDRARTEAEYVRPHALFSGEWVEDPARRARAAAWLRPLMEGRVRWMGGRPHGLLMYMVTDPAYRRLGAASACVRYGIERCRELGIPAYLEASEQGKPVYEALGFEEMDTVYMSMDGVTMPFPVMIWWPPGTSEGDKRPALPDYKRNEA